MKYRSLRFDTKALDMDDLQGNAVVNYTEREVSYTRVIEHKHFDKNFGQPQSGKTVVSYEYPQNWRRGDEPYYPVNDEKNTALFQKYAELAKKRGDVIFGGRLGEYKYYDMDQVIGKALDVSQSELAQER